MGQVVFDGVTKRFGDVVAVDRLDLTVADGELLVLLGPSGCGKTTALRMVAGLEELDGGAVTIGDRVVNDLEAKDRDVAMVFQSYALYPHLTVERNIEFPLRQRGVDRAERKRKVDEVAATLGLTPYLGRKPGQLSGGQRQRVALARAIVRSPQAFLMDEPLSNLDAALRVQTRADIVALQERLGTTTLYVTHDQVEAMTMGHRIAVMDGGVLQQVAAPQALYAEPANTFVARFLGSPGMNLLPGVATEDAVAVAGGSVPLNDVLLPLAPVGRSVVAGVRPESLRLDPAGTLAGSVVIVEQLGAEAHVICTLSPDAQGPGTRVVVRQDAARPSPGFGDAVRIAVDPAAVHLFDADGGARL
ncbi:MAG TPA: ABC transporter ATP-binding protein [Acidimicrobiales bacterium]|nr:ABC transporter ATP-binding protein [Acidimicrobiales bacterium]